MPQALLNECEGPVIDNRVDEDSRASPELGSVP